MEHPEFMRVRLAVRRGLAALTGADGRPPLALVGLSGGADSLALAAALAAEAAGARVRAGALVVDHGLQDGSSGIAARAAAQATELGLDPVRVRRVEVAPGGGPEAAARTARYGAFAEAAAELGAAAVLTAHTRDDQAEQVLLALARGSGARSIAGIPPARRLEPGVLLLRPLLAEAPEVTRHTTVAACRELGLDAWQDPHNSNHAYARVRVRESALPALADALGPGVGAGLARSADLAREDAEALEHWSAAELAGLLADADTVVSPGAGSAAAQGEGGSELVTLGAAGIARLGGLPAAVRQRVIRRLAREHFGATLSRDHALAVAALVTHWRGQGPVFVPGLRVSRSGGELRVAAHTGSPRDAGKGDSSS